VADRVAVGTALELDVDRTGCDAELASEDEGDVWELVADVPLSQAIHVRTLSPTAALVTQRATTTIGSSHPEPER
jgi:hypothetical protein